MSGHCIGSFALRRQEPVRTSRLFCWQQRAMEVPRHLPHQRQSILRCILVLTQ